MVKLQGRYLFYECQYVKYIPSEGFTFNVQSTVNKRVIDRSTSAATRIASQSKPTTCTRFNDLHTFVYFILPIQI